MQCSLFHVYILQKYAQEYEKFSGKESRASDAFGLVDYHIH